MSETPPWAANRKQSGGTIRRGARRTALGVTSSPQTIAAMVGARGTRPAAIIVPLAPV
jgi:hypothetical protein